MYRKIILSFTVIFSLLFSSVFCTTANAYQISGFKLYAKNALLVCLDNNKVVFEREADKRIYPASITKIMTSLIVLDECKDLDSETVTASWDNIHDLDGTGLTMLNLKVGETMSVHDALYAVLMCSSADVCMALSEHFGGTVDGFVKKMNRKAKELGMNSTHFTNVTGIHDDDHYTTVNDVYKMTLAALKYDEFVKITETCRYHLQPTNMHSERTILTTNFLQDVTTAYYYRYASGVKTGYTDQAGRCLVSTAKKNGYSYLCIVMNCPPKNEKGQSQRKEFTDSKNLYEWIFNNYDYKVLCDTSSPIGEAKVSCCKDTDHVSLVLEKDFSAILPKLANDSTVTYKIHTKEKEFKAPVKAGDVLGTVDIYYANEKLATENIVAAQTLESSNLLTFVYGIKALLTSKVFIAIVVIIFIGILVFVLSSIIMTKRARSRRRKIKYKRY